MKSSVASPHLDMRRTVRGLALGVTWGTIYGLALRLIADLTSSAIIVAMSLAFLVVGPFAIGYLTVRPHPAPSPTYRALAPWVPMALGTALAMAIGLEGRICAIIGAPLMLAASSLGGLLGGRRPATRSTSVAGIVALPFVFGLVESNIVAPDRLDRVESSITISAPRSVVWREIASVREIAPDELPPALYLRMGFPRPLSAVIDREGVGAVRQARFDGGVLFLETVTSWEDGHLLSFRIAAQTDSIPPSTLDRHVIIGGPYFDVLEGTYTIDSLGPATSRLRLASKLRLSTHFNWYASWWSGMIMSSIQNTILEVQKARAEAITGALGSHPNQL